MTHIWTTVLITVLSVAFGFGTCALLTASKIGDLETEIARQREQLEIEHKAGWDEAIQSMAEIAKKKRGAGGMKT